MKSLKAKAVALQTVKSNRLQTGGADGTRTRDLRRDRLNLKNIYFNNLAFLSTSYLRLVATHDDTKHPIFAPFGDTISGTLLMRKRRLSEIEPLSSP